ncbi:MAG: DUF998 domain-containing protein [Methanomicrobiales archaeon]
MKNFKISFLVILTVFIFLIFTLNAVILFPGNYSPLNNYLSDLGNSSYNSTGYLFFNLGCIITGMLLILFFYNLKKYFKPVPPRHKLLIISQIVGIYASFSLIMVGVFSEDYGFIHWIWSASFFTSLMITLILININILKDPQFTNKIAYYGFFVVIINLCFIIIYLLKIWDLTPLFEWITVILSLGWLLLIAYNFSSY